MITLYCREENWRWRGMYLFSCFSRLNCYNQHGRYNHLANKLVLARAVFTSCLGHFLFLVMILQPFFFSQRQTVPLFTISLTPRASTMCNRKGLRSIPFIDSVTCCFPVEYFSNPMLEAIWCLS